MVGLTFVLFRSSRTPTFARYGVCRRLPAAGFDKNLKPETYNLDRMWAATGPCTWILSRRPTVPHMCSVDERRQSLSAKPKVKAVLFATLDARPCRARHLLFVCTLEQWLQLTAVLATTSTLGRNIMLVLFRTMTRSDE